MPGECGSNYLTELRERIHLLPAVLALPVHQLQSILAALVGEWYRLPVVNLATPDLNAEF